MKLTITLLQRDVIWIDPHKNVLRAEEAIRAAPRSDVYVLPEMFSTGFITQPDGFAETDGSETLKWMKNMAIELDAAIAGSIAIQQTSDESFRNRLYFVTPDGNEIHYDKHHLFTYSGEHLHYTPGDKRVVVEFRGVRFLLLVCYDLRFPIWSRNQEDYDCILYVASWPKQRIDAWEKLLYARAIENQCYVAGVNRIGSDPNCDYCGCTLLIDPYGNKVSSCELNKEMSITGCIDIELLESFRKNFQVLKDRDIK